MNEFWILQQKYNTCSTLNSSSHLTMSSNIPSNHSSTCTTSQQPSRFKWSTTLDNLPKFNAKTALPHPDILSIKWTREEVKSVHRSSEGSTGVYFVQLEDGKATVVKPALNSLTSDLLSTLISLFLGVWCPRILLVETSTETGVRLLESLKAVDPTWTIIARLFDQAFVYHMEFVRGVSVPNVPDKMISLFHVDECGNLSKRAKTWLETLGRILALDLFVNNGDRLPLVWDNQGNSGNLFVSISSTSSDGSDYDIEALVNMDTQINAIDCEIHSAEYQKYALKVDEFLRTLLELKQASDQEKKSNFAYSKLSHILKMISKWSGIEIIDENLFIPEICKGLFEAIQRLSSPKMQELLNDAKDYFNALSKEKPGMVNMKIFEHGYLKNMEKLFSSYSAATSADHFNFQ